MKQNAHDSWENLKSSVVQTAQNLKESAVQAFHNMVSGIGNALSSLGSTVRNGFWSAISFITSLPSQAVQWGRDFIDGIVSGIRERHWQSQRCRVRRGIYNPLISAFLSA